VSPAAIPVRPHIPGSCYWNVGIGREKGEVENDEEGGNYLFDNDLTAIVLRKTENQ
jgi:hypothetical protein